MKDVVKKEILYDLDNAIKILQLRENVDHEQLKTLSNHAIEDAAAYKDLDIISVSVLIYSIYKTVSCLDEEKYSLVLKYLSQSQTSLQHNEFGKYNAAIKRVFRTIKECSGHVREHLQNVMQAAKIKKGTVLLKKGLSIGQAAGLMGLSNWDLQQYASKTTYLEGGHEAVTATKRLERALKLFGVFS